MRKLLGVLIALGVVLLLAWLGAQYALQKVLDEALVQVRAAAEQRDIDLQSIGYDHARFVSMRGVRIDGAVLRVAQQNRAATEIAVARLTVRAEDLSASSIRVHADDLSVVLPGDPARVVRGALDVALAPPEGKTGAPALAAHVLGEARALAREGACALPLSFAGEVTFALDDVSHTLPLETESTAAGSALVIPPGALVALSTQLDPAAPLRPVSARVLSRHPLAVPSLFRIQRRASETARSAIVEDPTVPEDAYRHVLWSYLMTRVHGAELAEAVGDAHEEGDTGNSAAEKAMDLNNNAAGRRYALATIPEDQLLDKVRTDPAVIRAVPSP